MHMVHSQVLLAARACMGIGEGVAMPAMNNLLSRRAPNVLDRHHLQQLLRSAWTWHEKHALTRSWGGGH